MNNAAPKFLIKLYEFLFKIARISKGNAFASIQ
jgi:hypothetical protein